MDPNDGTRSAGQPDAAGVPRDAGEPAFTETPPDDGRYDESRYTFEPVAAFDHPSGVWIPPVVDLASEQSALRAVAADETDWAATETAAALPGATAVWRTWRSLRTGPERGASSRVYLVEVDRPDADLPVCAAEVTNTLAARGVEEPLVEMHALSSPATDYFLRARQGAALLWAAEATRKLSLARAFDGADPATGPYFEDAHPRLRGAEKEAVLGYLESAPLLLSSTDQMEDILDPGSGRQIFLNYYTDGSWTWNETTVHYLREHGIAPPSTRT